MAAVGAVQHVGEWQKIVGIAGVNDNDVVIEAENMERYREFTLISTAGAMDVTVSLDGTNFTTAPLTLADLGAVLTDPVIVTVASRMYRFLGLYKTIRISQVGAPAVANAVLLSGRDR